MYKIDLPPLPVKEGDNLDFLQMMDYIVNSVAKSSVVARISDRDYDLRIKRCLLKPNHEREEFELFIYSYGNDTEPIWHELVSAIKINKFSKGFWLELSADSAPSIVLYIP